MLVSLPLQRVKLDRDGNFLRENDDCDHAGNTSFHLPHIYWVLCVIGADITLLCKPIKKWGWLSNVWDKKTIKNITTQELEEGLQRKSSRVESECVCETKWFQYTEQKK